LQLARFNLGKIKNVTDDRQQMAPGAMDMGGVFPVFLWPSSPNTFSSIISEKPIMAFSGVHNSWLILARNSVFERLAISAASAAAASWRRSS